jgi:hypothetical protein
MEVTTGPVVTDYVQTNRQSHDLFRFAGGQTATLSEADE